MMVLRFISPTATLCFGLLLFHVYAEPEEDKQALLDFIRKVPHYHSLNWNQSTSVCNSWTGVTCNADRSRVIALRLPGVGFRGSIPLNTLGRLSSLQILSLRHNRFLNPLPSDLSKLGNLTDLYLQHNRFSGPLPLDFSVWDNLVVLNLSDNNFNGSIPSSISNLSHLAALDLSNNKLSGEIPDINIPSLQYLNLSYNDLRGSIPRSLQRFPSSTFLGNNLSPGGVASPPIHSMPSPSSQPAKERSHLSETALLGIIISACVLGFAAIAVLMLVFCKSKEGNDKERHVAKYVKKEKSLKKRAPPPPEIQEESQKIIFFEGSSLAFDLEDLLRASAEVLGKGTHGMTYKAALEDSTTVVVKRLKEVSVGKWDFEQQMEVVGSIRHENIAALRAYYYSKDEKLVVYDYFSLGSASTLLHANRTENRIPLDWETRLRIAVGAARGIAHIHTENNRKLVHGNIKASNIFLNSQLYGCVSDVGFATIVTPLAPPTTRTAGYWAPEVADPRKASQASDVYSFGVFLLELLTGKCPLGEGMNLVKWVNSVVREEWTAEVFDVELLSYPNIEEEMVQMLQLGMSCAVGMPEQRPKMGDVVRMLEDIRPYNTGTWASSECSTPTPPSHVVEIGSSSGAGQ